MSNPELVWAAQDCSSCTHMRISHMNNKGQCLSYMGHDLTCVCQEFTEAPSELAVLQKKYDDLLHDFKQFRETQMSINKEFLHFMQMENTLCADMMSRLDKLENPLATYWDDGKVNRLMAWRGVLVKPCPFCGGQPSVLDYFYDDPRFQCRRCEYSLKPEVWQTRTKLCPTR